MDGKIAKSQFYKNNVFFCNCLESHCYANDRVDTHVTISYVRTSAIGRGYRGYGCDMHVFRGSLSCHLKKKRVNYIERYRISRPAGGGYSLAKRVRVVKRAPVIGL